VGAEVSKEKYVTNCPGCRPVAFNPATGEMVPANHPLALALDRVWETTNEAERAAFHRCTCLNSRSPADLMICAGIMGRVKKASMQ
jgi:hypothetical protein